MKKQSYIAICLLFAILMLMAAGCEYDWVSKTIEQPVSTTILHVDVDADATEQHSEKTCSSASEFPPDEISNVKNAINYGNNSGVTAITLGEAFEDNNQAETGTFELIVNSVQLSSNTKELGIDPSEFDPYNSVSTYDGNSFLSWKWPNYVSLESGELAESLVFVLVDITATSIDAVSASHASGSMPNGYDSQYIFKASNLRLVDLYQENIYESDLLNTYYVQGRLVWFSQQEQRPEDRYAYELLPGEEINYQIGYIIGLSDNHTENLHLSTSNILEAPGVTWIQLGLSSEE